MSTKVTFTLPAEEVAEATAGLLLGDFNNWDQQHGTVLKKQKDGSMKAIVSLTPGETYHYRYLLNDGRWVNDDNEDHYDHNYSVHNCVITVASEAAKTAKAKAPKKEAAPKTETAPKKAAAPKKATAKK